MSRVVVIPLVLLGALTAIPAEGAVATRFTVTAKVSATSVDTGQPVRIFGTVSPARPKRKVSLQQYVSGKWRVISTKRLGPRSGYSFKVFPALPGVKRYRVTKAAESGVGPGRSKARTVTAYRWRYLADMNWVSDDGFDYGSIDINGVTLSHSVWAQAQYHEHSMEVNLKRACTTFQGTVGLGDESSSDAVDTLDVSTDGNSLFTNDFAPGSSDALSLDVQHAFRLKLDVMPVSGDGYGAFGNAQLRCAF